MKELKDKVAVVTGAGSGIGRSMALAFAREGMKLVVVDVDPGSLDSVSGEVRKTGNEVMSRVVDVGDRGRMAGLADDVFRHFGRVHVLCNNAGVGGGGMFSDIHLEDWDWVLGVDLYGVVYGIHFFLKRMIESNEECHIVNTSSIAGLLPAQSSVYGVAKAGVVALSECLASQTSNTKVGVSVLCPGYVRTNITRTSEAIGKTKEGLYRPTGERQAIIRPFMENMRRQIEGGIDPDIIALMVIDSIREKRFYILPHPGYLQFVEMKMNTMSANAASLNAAMASLGVVFETKEKKTHTNESPYFSISCPADWVEQEPTIISRFDFGVSSPLGLPDLRIHIIPAPPDGLKDSIARLSQFLSGQFGIRNSVVSEREATLADGTPATEGEIEMTFDGINSFMQLVLNAVQGDKLVSVRLTSTKNRYDDAMKESLKEIAYSLRFGK